MSILSISQQDLIQRIFPDISLSEEDHDDWLTTLQQAIQDLMDESNSQLLDKDEQIKQLKDELDEGTQLTDQLKDTLSNSVSNITTCTCTCICTLLYCDGTTIALLCSCIIYIIWKFYLWYIRVPYVHVVKEVIILWAQSINGRGTY